MSVYESSMSPEILNRFIHLVKVHTGIKMGENKRSMLQGRIRSRINKLGLASYEDYLNVLEATKEETQDFVNAVTTNETSFYRTPRVWDYFAKEFIPNWYQKNLGKTLKIWSAAASSGEEAYTMSIFCKEFKSTHPDFQYQIVGTDICTEVLQKAQDGEYNKKSIDNIRTKLPLLFTKYIIGAEDSFKVTPELKTNIKFIQHNLFNTLKLSDKFDIVFIRNVMIYFDASDQEKVLRNIQKSMIQNAVLILGESESLNGLNVPFKFLAPQIYQESES